MGDEGAPTTLFGTDERIGAMLDHSIVDKYAKLDQKGKICAEYVWIGGTGSDLRSKTKSLDKMPKSPEDLPVWNFDGSSTGQAPGQLNVGSELWSVLSCGPAVFALRYSGWSGTLL